MAEALKWSTSVIVTPDARPYLTGVPAAGQFAVVPIDAEGRPFLSRNAQRRLGDAKPVGNASLSVVEVRDGPVIGFLRMDGAGISDSYRLSLVNLIQAFYTRKNEPPRRVWIPLLTRFATLSPINAYVDLILDAVEAAQATYWPEESRIVIAADEDISADELANVRMRIEERRGHPVFELQDAIAELGVSPAPEVYALLARAASLINRQRSHLNTGRISTRLILIALLYPAGDAAAAEMAARFQSFVKSPQLVTTVTDRFIREIQTVTPSEPILGPVIFSQEAAEILKYATSLNGTGPVTLPRVIHALLLQARDRPSDSTAAKFLAEIGIGVPDLLREIERVYNFSSSPPGALARKPSDQYTSPFDDLPDIRRDTMRARAEARAFARIAALRDTRPPLAIGIFGDWGAGKSSFMEMIHDEIEKLPKGRMYHDRVVQIRFNAWHYIETNLWASLVSNIYETLDRELQQEVGDEVNTLYAGFATGRRLEAEAASRVLVAEQALAVAHAGVQQAAQSRPDVTRELGTMTRDVVKAFYDQLDKDDQKTIRKAIGDIETESIDLVKLEQALKQSRSLVTRARLVVVDMKHAWRERDLNALVWPLALAGTLLLAVIFGTAIAQTLSSVLGWLAGIGATVAGIIAALATLPQKVGGVVGLFAQLQHRREEARKTALAVAEGAVASAKTELANALTAFSAASPIGRLTSFIRNKAADESYARHLGLVAMIRKDFELLTACLIDAQVPPRPGTPEAAHITEARRVLAEMGDKAESLKPFGRIVLYIDDLDRCSAEKVVEVLQAVHLLLAFRLFVVVVAVDYRWLRAALERVYAGQIRNRDELASDNADAADYLEKIFQIPYWVRRLDEQTSSDFIRSLIEDSREIIPSSTDVAPPATRGEQTPNTANRDQATAAPVVTDARNGPEPAAIPGPPSAAGQPQTDLGAGVALKGEDHAESPAEELDLSPVEITANEQGLFVQLAPYAGRTPRQLKRFLNVYRVIKASLAGNDPRWAETLGLLAVATRAPDLFVRLRQNLPEDPTLKELEPLLRNLGSTADVRDARAIVDRVETELELSPSASNESGAFLTHLKLVERFSFCQPSGLLPLAMPNGDADHRTGSEPIPFPTGSVQAPTGATATVA